MKEAKNHSEEIFQTKTLFPICHTVLRKRSIPGSPRGSVKSNNLSTAATIHTSPLTVSASTSAATVAGLNTTTNNLSNPQNQSAPASSWDAGHHHYHNSAASTSGNSKSSSSAPRSGNFFSALDSALTMTPQTTANQQQSQPSTSQTAGVSVSLSNTDGAASKLNKSILTSSTLAAATAAAFSGESDNVNLNGKFFDLHTRDRKNSNAQINLNLFFVSFSPTSVARRCRRRRCRPFTSFT